MANRYRVLNGNWDLANSWSTTSGGAGGAAVPTAADDVFFDANTPNGTHTVNLAATTLSLDFTGFTGTLAGSSALNIAGSLTLATGMTRTYTGAITFSSTSTGRTLTFAGKTTASTVTFNGVGGEWTVQDTWNNGTSNVTLTNGSLVTNNQTLTIGAFSSSNSNTRSVTLGSSTLNLSSRWACGTSTNLTVDAGTSHIIQAGSGNFEGGGKTYYDVTISYNATASTSGITGANTFHDLRRANCNNAQFNVADDQTCTGEFEATSSSQSQRGCILSSVVGTSRTISAATVSLTNVDFQDITGAGAATWTGTSIGDCGGNSGITFTTPTTRYWVGGTGNWQQSSEWSASSGGASGATVPLPQDDVIFDANSFSAGSQTVTAASSGLYRLRLAKNIDFTGVTNSPTFAISFTSRIFGSLTLVSGMSMSGNNGLVFMGRSSYTITTAGQTLDRSVTFESPGGTYTLQDALTIGSTRTFSLDAGTFDANDFNTTAGLFDFGTSITRTVVMGSGTWEVTGSGSVWSGSSTGLTVTPESSTIKFTNNSASSKNITLIGKTWNNFWNACQNTGIVSITSAGTVNDFKVDPGRDQRFPVSQTVTVTTFDAVGSLGNEINLQPTTGTATLTKAGGGTITVDYCTISNLTVNPSDTWFADNSTDGGGNTRWTFNSSSSSSIKTLLGVTQANLKNVNGVTIANIKAIGGVSNV